MNDLPALTELSEQECVSALQRYHIIQPFLDGQATLKTIAQTHGIAYRTAQRWVRRYRRHGLVGLAHSRRRDRNERRVEPTLQQLIKGLALQKTRPSAAAVYRQAKEIAQQQEWSMPSYSCVYDIVRSLDPALVKLALEGSNAYQQYYDLLYRREASAPNEIWQADHTCMNIWLVTEDGETIRPWLTAIEDDYSRCIAGYGIWLEPPNTLNTCLTLRQAIWRKSDPRWSICGIPAIFYSDHGSDFTSKQLEQVSADLKMQLIFSTVGMPRGRGRIERFFRTVDQLFLHRLPGYIAANDGKPVTKPTLSIVEFQDRFNDFLLNTYLCRHQKELGTDPKSRWEESGFLPHMPESLEQLDLLLLTAAKTRVVRRDGIHFHNLRYLDTALAAYIGEKVVIRYDPRDMAEIRVFHKGEFVCRAFCQELTGQKVSLKEIVQARRARKRELRKTLDAHAQLLKQYVDNQFDSVAEETVAPEQPKLKRYYNE
jgi:putative transposase